VGQIRPKGTGRDEPRLALKHASFGTVSTAPTRQAAIKRALVHLLANGDAEQKPAA
jgi:hypothetical protein